MQVSTGKGKKRHLIPVEHGASQRRTRLESLRNSRFNRRLVSETRDSSESTESTGYMRVLIRFARGSFYLDAVSGA